MRAVFLDRDGIINQKIENGYVLKWEDFKFLPQVADAIHLINQKKIPVIIISNQACVGKGLITVQELREINDRMLKELKDKGAKVDDIFICPHKPEDDCDCRKPKAGLFKQALKKYPAIEIKESWFIGDSKSDMEAGVSAGCKTYLLNKSDELKGVLQRLLI